MIYRTVNVEGLVTYCQNGYSVPWRYIGSVLPVRVTEKELIIYGPQVEEIARHPLLPRTATGQRVVHKEHRPVEDARRRQAQLEERFAELGEPGRRFLEGLLRAQRYGKDQAQAGAGPAGDLRPGRPDRRTGAGRHGTARIPTRPWNASCRPRLSPRVFWKHWPRKSDVICHLGSMRSLSHPGPPRTTNPSATRSRPKMPSRPTKLGQPNTLSRPHRPTTLPQGDLRQKIVDDFQALRIPLKPDQLDSVLTRRDRGDVALGISAGTPQ